LLSNVSKSSNIKKRNKIGKRGDPYKILVGISIVSLSNPLNTILVEYPVRKAPLISRLNIDTI
jgi:hypothetical protein